MKRLLTICLVLLLCTSAYGTKTTAADDSTAIAVVDTVVDTIAILNSDELALLGVGTGNVFYVDSAATGSGTGADWTNAEITIELGLSNCTANAGDFIVCAPYHAETASAGTFDLALDGVTVIGLGKGDAMTTITYDGTSDTCLLGASGDGCTIRNIKFYTATDDIVSALVVEAACTDWIIEDCVFEATTTDEFIDTIYVTTGGSNNGIIRRCKFIGDTVASNSASKASINFIDADFLQIYDNEFIGDVGDAHIFNETTASNFVTIRDNRIVCGYIGTGTLDTTPGISLVTTTTGWIQDNFIVTNVATPDAAIVAADCYLANNDYSEVQGNPANTASAGLRCAEVRIAALATPVTNLFAVTGGPIIIRDIIGVVTDTMETATCLINYNIDPDAGTATVFATDATALEVSADAIGTSYIWDGVIATDLTATTNGPLLVAGTDVSEGIFCPIGMIELAATATNTGDIAFYMVYTPLSPLTVVTPQ